VLFLLVAAGYAIAMGLCEGEGGVKVRVGLLLRSVDGEVGDEQNDEEA
jgi:hypothetical protein